MRDEWYLLKENQKIAKMEFLSGKPYYLTEIYEKPLLPIGIFSQYNDFIPTLIKSWYDGRTIPKERPNLSKVMAKLGVTKDEAFLLSYGISLTDTYWFCKNPDEIRWEDVNYHQNGFDSVLYKACCLEDCSIPLNRSPDFTTDGVLEKYWVSVSGVPTLLKRDGIHQNRAVANEIFASKVATILGIQCVPYTLTRDDKGPMCACPSFVTDSHTCFVNGLQLQHEFFGQQYKGNLNYFSKDLGFQKEITQLRWLDAFLHQVDRHDKNYGFFENGSFAPIFDNGNCLGAERIWKPDYKCQGGDMKFFSGNREDLLFDFPTDKLPTEEELLSSLQKIYEQCSVPEDAYSVAKLELSNSFSLLPERNYFLERE